MENQKKKNYRRMLKNCESITLYRNRDCFGGGRQGLPVHHRSAGEDVQREG